MGTGAEVWCFSVELDVAMGVGLGCPQPGAACLLLCLPPDKISWRFEGSHKGTGICGSICWGCKSLL